MKLIASTPSTIDAFLRRSVGIWHSQRRYYTLNSSQDPILEAVSRLEITYLDGDRPELVALAEKHQQPQSFRFDCGAQITWTSTYTNVERKPLEGTTLFGIHGQLMYRDRGFSTPHPIVATFDMPSPDLMHLQTRYDGAKFEEEIKFIGQKHRTRQTIISKYGQEVMIGQYLETLC